LENKKDSQTTGIVRLTLEAAFLKYGRLDVTGDIASTTEIAPSQLYGGMLKQALVRIVGERKAKQWLRLFARSQEGAPAEFTDESLLNLYRLEGYAYEYWLTTGSMRTLGKEGGRFWIEESRFGVSRNAEFDFLIRSYDKRIEGETFSASSIGIT